MRTMCAVGVATAVVLGARPVAAQEPPPIAFDTFTLGNGLKFVVHEDHSTPIVAVNVWYDVGSANEPPRRSGFAHLFEHMLFEETENLDKGEFAELILGAGGTYNGTTNTDRTAYFETVPANRLNLALWLEAERMARLRVTKENFEREREVVKEERRRSIDNRPYGSAFLTLDTLMNDWPPYDHTVIGSMEDLNAATADDVLGFYRRFYVPNNATVVIAGDVTVAEVRALAEQYFGWVSRGAEPEALPRLPPVPRSDGERRATLEDKLANTPLYMAGFTLPPHDHRDTYALQLLSGIFSEGESSRLFQRLVKDEKAALTVFAGMDTRVGPSSFYFAALPNQGVGIERIEALVNDEVEKLQKEGVSERELQKSKNQLRAGQIMGRQTVFAKAESLHHYRLYHAAIGEINTDLANYMAVTPDDIRRAAGVYLVPANRTAILVMPGKSASQGGGGDSPSGSR
ncbi:MAG: insulinase family protein [Gemmatimonadetes bacterium]|nr:insulinase family protein [Gemmatimonadota bacterium]